MIAADEEVADEKAAAEEDEEVVPAYEEDEEVAKEDTEGVKRPRTQNYGMAEDIALCHAWINVSLDAISVGADQSKDKFWSRIEDYYTNIVTVPSNRTQGSLGRRWGTIQEHCNRWSRSVDQRNYETTPRRSRISIGIEAGDDDEEHHKRLEGANIARTRKKNGGFGAYKDELVAIIETKKALADECKEDKLARWNELKALEDEKWRVKTRTNERRLALEEERLAKEKKAEERVIMFMDPSTMDSTARIY
ncbi:hypothetical protein ACQ4PT_054632 [Festuca glaucescens]